MVPSGRRRTPPRPLETGGAIKWTSTTSAGLREARLDVEEGADIIMVKPAMAFGDVIARVREAVPVPVASYSVSGEYTMVKCAAQAGAMDEARLVCEMAASAFRAGSDVYLTYFARELARFLDEGRLG